MIDPTFGHVVVLPEKIQREIFDEMRWIWFTKSDTKVTLVARYPGGKSSIFSIAALLPWNRNRKPKSRGAKNGKRRLL